MAAAALPQAATTTASSSSSSSTQTQLSQGKEEKARRGSHVLDSLIPERATAHSPPSPHETHVLGREAATDSCRGHSTPRLPCRDSFNGRLARSLAGGAGGFCWTVGGERVGRRSGRAQYRMPGRSV
jgi:hypothetical protein